VKIVLVTACGAKKLEKPAPAGELYKSSRIRYLRKKSRQLEIPFYILSAKYGLVNSETVIEPYEKKMTAQRCEELLDQIVSVLKNFDVVIYYRGGAGKVYAECIEKACQTAGVKLVSFGYANTGDINKLEEVLKNVR
jgi:predicted site-specific integrase-resolvase